MTGWRNRPEGWGRGSRLFHWLGAGLILFMLGLGFRMAYLTPDLAQRYALVQWHKSWGAVAFALVLGRMLWRIAAGPRPALPGPGWQRGVARVTHGMLYALMVAMPLSGWVSAAASPLQDLLGQPNMVFGLFALPDPWMPGDAGLSEAAGRVHALAALLLTGLVTLHVGAALWHQLVHRDRLITRMWRG